MENILGTMDPRQGVINRAERKDLVVMEKITDIMQQQAEALAVVAKSLLTNSEAMGKIAETQHVQALAVDKIVNNFENIGTSLCDIRHAITNVNDTLKEYYSVSAMQQRNNSIINTFD